MRILVISNLYPPFAVGGYERLCADVCLRLKDRGHDVQVLTSTYGAGRERVDGHIRRLLPLEARFGAIYCCNGHRSFVQTAMDVARTAQLTRRAIREVAPDVVYVWNLGYLHRAVLDAARRSGLPLLFHLGDAWPKYRDAWSKHWLRRAQQRHLRPAKRAVATALHAASLLSDSTLRADDHVTCSCESLKHELLAAGLPIAGAAIVHEGIPLGEVGEVNVARHRGSQPPRSLLFAGQLLPHKGVHTAIEALSLLRRDGHALGLTVLGTGDPAYAASLHELVKRLSLGDAVDFQPAVHRPRLADVMAQHDLFIFPSIWPEPWSLVLLTAMACGLTVACTATGGTAELARDGENAVVFEANDAASLAEAVRKLAANAELRMAIASNARRLVRERYGIDTMVRQLERHLSAAVARRPQRAQEPQAVRPVAARPVEAGGQP